jgi:hypothetical protein
LQDADVSLKNCSAAAPPAAPTAAAEGNATANPASTTSGVANPGDSEIESNWDQVGLLFGCSLLGVVRELILIGFSRACAKVIDNFDAMELKPELLRGIYAVRLSACEIYLDSLF